MYLATTGLNDVTGNLLSSNLAMSEQSHSAWRSIMYPQLFPACQILPKNGATLLSIDDHKIHNLRLLMNEIFSKENSFASVTGIGCIHPKLGTSLL
ncbi:MAG: hypothetical protein C4346_12505 [Chloroflexota bacterium]